MKRKKEITMETIINELKSGKTRIVKINRTEEKAYRYVARCFEDMTKAKNFHCGNKQNQKNCYFVCVIGKVRLYLFLDEPRRKIVICKLGSCETSYIPQSEYDAVRTILLSGKNAGYFLERLKKIELFHKAVCIVTSLLCVFIAFGYLIQSIPDEKLALMAIYLMFVLAAQDCVKIYSIRFEKKQNDKKVLLMIAAQVLYLLFTIAAFCEMEPVHPAAHRSSSGYRRRSCWQATNGYPAE